MEAVQIKPDQKKHTLPINEAIIQGQIQQVRKINTQEGVMFLTLVRLPAPNEYEYPSTIELQSAEPIGEKGDNITQHIRCSGVASQYEQKKINPHTGEETINTIRTARNQFRVMDL